MVAVGPLLRVWETIAIDEWDHSVADLAFVIQVVIWLASDGESPAGA